MALAFVVADSVTDTGSMALGFVIQARLPHKYFSTETFSGIVGRMYHDEEHHSMWHTSLIHPMLKERHATTREVNLPSFFRSLAECVLLVTRADLATLEAACLEARINFEVYFYEGNLATS